ncbi:MAG TPA: NAD(P)/FAD-dependent oxidoreductase [Thermoanaerobaculia bacterium]|nr:NAD(P)/FAD-dependent oxidoreductase [Thermoanaerobaculia bacterium]
MHKADILVVGAGLAGLQCARKLAGRGLDVLLIDRKASVADAVQTTGIFVRKTWEDFPLPAEQLGPAIGEVTLHSPAGRTLRLTAPHDEFRVGRMPWIYLHMLEQCVRAGVRWLPSARFVSPDEIERGGRRERARVRTIVGADGPRSAVARAFGLDQNREFLVGIEDIVATGGGSPALHCFLDPRLAPGYIGWFVDDGVEAHIGVAGYPRRFDPLESLARLRASLKAGRTIERRGGLIPVGGILRRIGGDHALLVGDAAGAVSPLTAGGIDAALRLSEFAADVIANGDLRAYSGERFRARFITRRWMRRAMSLAASPALVELGFSLLRLAPMRRIAEHIFFARRSFPDVSTGCREGAPASAGVLPG